mmetsp:Transcript_16773/g.54607  ORF Transcript_16773/g.54607 Transcript_16773/m.54607 type:complete len:458 (-) Transcript_16773:185-1558(-)
MEAANELRRVGEGAPPSLQAGVCARLGHPRGLAPRGARVDGVGTELLLDAHELVVLCVAVGAAGRARLDLAGAQSDGQVGNGGVLGLARAMGAHDTPARLLAHLDRVDRLGDGPDLVHLEQQRVARLVVDGLPDARHVGDGEVIADDLAGPADVGRHLGPRRPVVLVERVFDGDDGEVLAERRVEVGKLDASHLEVGRLLGLGVPGAEVVAVLAFDEELGRRHVHPDLALALVPRSLDSLHHQLQTGAGIARGSEPALVADRGGVTAKLLLDDALERVVALAADPHRLLERLGAHRDDEVLLEGEFVASVRASVDHVEARHRQHHLAVVAGQLGDVPVERDAGGLGRRLGHRHRHAEDRVGAQLGLVGRAVERTHLVVDSLLVEHRHADQLLGEDVVDRGHRLDHALAEVPRLVAVAQLVRLVDAGGGARRHRRADLDAALGDQVDLDGRVAARVED